MNRPQKTENIMKKRSRKALSLLIGLAFLLILLFMGVISPRSDISKTPTVSADSSTPGSVQNIPPVRISVTPVPTIELTNTVTASDTPTPVVLSPPSTTFTLVFPPTNIPLPTETLADTLPPILATPTIQPTSPQFQSGFTLTSLSTPAKVDGYATATIKTSPGASCSISYYVPSGALSKAKGLVAKNADTNGVCSWTWKIGSSTKRGTGKVVISAGGSTHTFQIVIQ
jgi:hypothetical protein